MMPIILKNNENMIKMEYPIHMLTYIRYTNNNNQDSYYISFHNGC